MTCGCGFFAGKKLPPTVLLTKRATIAAWIWFPFYFLWPIISNWLVYDLLNFNSNDSFGAALQNFLDHLGSIFLILLLILYVMNFIRLDQHFKNIFLKLIDLLDFDASFIGERHPMPCTLKSEYHPIGTSPC